MDSRAGEAVKQLCPKCGLCCNGVLFADVELQPGDDAGALRRMGLGVFRKGKTTAFSQPCGCFVNSLCCIYDDRPKRCRSFECGLLKQVAAGTMTTAQALQRINHAQRAADTVGELVREFGQTDETVPMTHRYAAVMEQPIDLSATVEQVEQRGELMMAVARLMKILQRDFLGLATVKSNNQLGTVGDMDTINGKPAPAIREFPGTVKKAE